MLKESKVEGVAQGSPEGARRVTGGEPCAAVEVKRWSAGRKKEVVLRLLRNEPVADRSREVSVPIYKRERWRDRALAGIEAGLKERAKQHERRFHSGSAADGGSHSSVRFEWAGVRCPTPPCPSFRFSGAKRSRTIAASP